MVWILLHHLSHLQCKLMVLSSAQLHFSIRMFVTEVGWSISFWSIFLMPCCYIQLVTHPRQYFNTIFHFCYLSAMYDCTFLSLTFFSHTMSIADLENLNWAALSNMISFVFPLISMNLHKSMRNCSAVTSATISK